MPQFMKMLNNISRSQAIYRHSKISADDLQSTHYAFALAICREPGRSQEDLARELCINKSTVARNLNYLEENGYIERDPRNSRSIRIAGTSSTAQVPVIGRVTAGQPILAVENVDSYFPIPMEFMPNEQCFMLTVSGSV